MPRVSDTLINGLVLQPAESGETGVFRRSGIFTASQSGDLCCEFGELEGAFGHFDRGREESELVYCEDGKGGFVYEVKII